MEQVIEVGSIWIGKINSQTEVEVMSFNSEKVKVKVLSNGSDVSSVDAIFYMSKDYFLKSYARQVSMEYLKGYEEGRKFRHSDAIEEYNTNLAEIKKYHYDMGYNDALAHMASEEAENRLEIKKQGFEDGYNTAIKEMSNNQVLGEDTEEESESISILDFGAIGDGYSRETYSVTEGVDIIKFIKNNFDNIKSFNQVGDVGSIEMFDKRNSGRNEQLEKELTLVEKYPHYYKDIRHLNIIDIYRFFDLFEVTDPCIQHSLKKLAVGGKRGAKDYEKDIKEAMDTLKRWEYMQEENKRGLYD